MKTTYAVLVFLGLADAFETVESDNRSEVPNWQETPDMRVQNEWEIQQCSSNAECGDTDYVCAGHRWEYNNQHEAARGCWHQTVCTGNQSWWMFDGRMIQFFCDNWFDAAMAEAQVIQYPIWPAEEPHWEWYEDACNTHEDCRALNGRPNQHCTDLWWVATEDGMSWGKGTACYSMDASRCHDGNISWALENVNYSTTRFSSYTQLWCRGEDYDFVTADATEPDRRDRAEPNRDDERRGPDSDDRRDRDRDDERRGPDSDDRRGPDSDDRRDRERDDERRDRDRDDERRGPDSDDRRDRDDERRGRDSDDRRGGRGGEGSRMIMEERDGQLRMEIVMGATKVVATAATLVASSLF